MMADELAEERLAGAAAGAGLCAQADGIDGGLAVANGSDDGPLVDAIAIADLRVVGPSVYVAATRCRFLRVETGQQFPGGGFDDFVGLEKPKQPAATVGKTQQNRPAD